jgi:hypothetical protein
VRRTPAILCLALALSIAGCAGPPPPAETFDWAGRPIQLQPPPKDWVRSGYNEGGWIGAYFVHARSAGERILVAEHQVIARRDGRPRIAELRANYATYDEGQFREQLQLARYRTDSPLSAQEAEVAGHVNDALDRAVNASYERDSVGLNQQLSAALAEAGQLQLSLADCLQRVTFRTAEAQDPSRWKETGRRDGTVAGVPALFVDYLYKGDDREYQCRDVYFVSDNRLFTVGYLGLPTNVGVFDRLLGSIHFPEWDPTQP